MTHDPLCPMEPMVYATGDTAVIAACACDLIGKVRERALREAVGAVNSMRIDLWPAEGWNGALDTAARAIHRLASPSCERDCRDGMLRVASFDGEDTDVDLCPCGRGK